MNTVENVEISFSCWNCGVREKEEEEEGQEDERKEKERRGKSTEKVADDKEQKKKRKDHRRKKTWKTGQLLGTDRPKRWRRRLGTGSGIDPDHWIPHPHRPCHRPHHPRRHNPHNAHRHRPIPRR